jgi:hypothetical protein
MSPKSLQLHKHIKFVRLQKGIYMVIDIEHRSRIVHREVAKYYVLLHPLEKNDIAHPDDEGVWEKMALGMRAIDEYLPAETDIAQDIYDYWVVRVEALVSLVIHHRLNTNKNQRLPLYDPIEEPLESYIDTVWSVYGRICLPSTALDQQQ